MHYDKPFTGNTATLEKIIREEIEKGLADEFRARQKYFLTPAACHKTENMQGNLPEMAIQSHGQGNPAGRSDDPNVGDTERILLGEPDTSFYMDRVTVPALNRINDQSKNRGIEILYGIGAAALLGMLLPPFRHKIQTVLTGIAMEGVELLGDVRSLIAKAKEDIEDLIAEASLGKLMKKPRQ